MAKYIKVKYEKLGREKLWGFIDTDEPQVIHLDNRLKGKKHLEIITHEAVHIILPDATEKETERISIALTNLLWSQGYRRVDNENKIPLQNGKR